jgi:hypothetical protein
MSEKTLAEKLFLKPGRNLLVLNAPAGFVEKMGPLPDFAKIVESPELADVIQFFVRSFAELQASLQNVWKSRKEGTVFWVCYPKLSGAIKSDLNRELIVTYASLIHLRGVFMISLDGDWSALRLMPE